MCLNCETDDERAECAFDADEHHPDQWPDDATREDYPDDLPEPKGWNDEKGKPYDDNWRLYSPYQGSKTPTEGRCNALLSNWESRYGEPRYCMRLPREKFVDDGGQFCTVHRQQEDLMERASDAFTHGVYSKTIRHVFDKLSSWQKLVVLGFYDSYVKESMYDFDPKFESFEIDFSEYDDELPLELVNQLDEKEHLQVGVPIPKDKEQRCYALYRAAIYDMKVTLADRETLPDANDDDENAAAMEKEFILKVIEDDDGNVEDVIKAFDEHHLNKAISRVDNDREDLLVFGGVPLEDGGDVDINVNGADELVFDLDEDDEPESPMLDDDRNPVEEAMDEAAPADSE